MTPSGINQRCIKFEIFTCARFGCNLCSETNPFCRVQLAYVPVANGCYYRMFQIVQKGPQPDRLRDVVFVIGFAERIRKLREDENDAENDDNQRKSDLDESDWESFFYGRPNYLMLSFSGVKFEATLKTPIY